VRTLAEARNGFVVVVGASGSGKSSLVAAGLLPRLSANAIEGSKDWLLPHVVPARAGERKQWATLRFTPGELGDNPFAAMASKLAPLLPDDPTMSHGVTDLAATPDALPQLVAAALEGKPEWAELLLFIDQFEELFTVVAEPYREPFVRVLMTAARAPRVRIVATLRGDFYARCLDWPDLAALLRGGTFPLGVPGRDALQDMVNGPAARAGLTLEEGLSDRILRDTGTDPGALALLAFALHELYEARTSEGQLTHAAYEAFGGVRGAISQRAEHVFTSLPVPVQDLLGGVFRELIEVNEQGVATRRRVLRARLASSPEADELVDAFTNARFLVTDRGVDGQPVVEVAHEALLREWPRLAGWVSDFANDLRLWQQAAEAADAWEKARRDPTHLWPHERLVLVERALHRLGIERATLGEPARSFLRPEAERLLDELERPETMHFRRAEIGDRLDTIGDPRPGVGLSPDGLPDIVWCEIPGGEVTLERLEHNREPTRARRLSFVVKPFAIAKYPITSRQYRAFLDDKEGYGAKRWWKDLQHQVTSGSQVRPIRQTGNCPATRVSWYDVMAYCRWLSERLGAEIRLPTEWEWQQAATGGRPDYKYPWGGEWIDGYANTEESGLSRTTGVGMYPQGASAQGVLDLAGNIDEWCLNMSEPEPWEEELLASPQTTRAETEPRAMSGGSWSCNRDFARCAYRYFIGPAHRDHIKDEFGFRVARYGEAEPLLRDIVAIREGGLPPNDPETGSALNNLALSLQATNQLAEAELQATNQLAEAERLFRRALTIDEQTYGPNDPDVAADLNNLAELLRATNRLAEAEPLVRRALTIHEQSYGLNHPSVAADLNSLAELLRATNRLAEAEPLVRRALTIHEQTGGPNHPDVAADLTSLAELLRATNRLAEAEPLFRHALIIHERFYGPNDRHVAPALSNLASFLTETNRLAEAEPLVRRALTIHEQTGGPNDPDVAADLTSLAELLRATNRLAEAEPLFRLALRILFLSNLKSGHSFPNPTVARRNYVTCLRQEGRAESEITAALRAVEAEARAQAEQERAEGPER
jgi:formylglycine-generating enzyme required for sulfatase activity